MVEGMEVGGESLEGSFGWDGLDENGCMILWTFFCAFW